MRVSPHCQRLFSQTNVRPEQVFVSLRQVQQCQQVQLRPQPQVASHQHPVQVSELSSRRVWDEEECECVCRNTCLPGQEMELNSCTCLPVPVTTCSISPVSLSTSHPAKIATYIGLIALTVLGLTIAVTLYYIVIR